MTLEKTIKTAVGSFVSNEISPNIYRGSAKRYITYNYSDYTRVNAESRPAAVAQLVQLHLYIPEDENPRTVKKNVFNALCNAGLSVQSVINASDGEGQHYVFEFEATDQDLVTEDEEE